MEDTPQPQAVDGGSILSELLKKPIGKRTAPVEEKALSGGETEIQDAWNRLLAEAEASKKAQKTRMQEAYERDMAMQAQLSRDKMNALKWSYDPRADEYVRNAVRVKSAPKPRPVRYRCKQCGRIGCQVGPQEEV